VRFGVDKLKSLIHSIKVRTLTPDFSDSAKIRISLKESGRNISFESADDQVHLLTNMSNLLLSEDKLFLEMPYAEVYELYYDEENNPIDDYRYLNLPPIFDGIIYIENYGNFSESDQVMYNFKFQDGRDHDIRKLRNNIVLVDGNERVLSPEMYKCLNMVAQYNQNETLSRDVASQFELLAFIKDYAERTAIALNQRLSIENKPIILDELKLDFTKTPQGLEIKPTIDSKSQEFNHLFVSAFDNNSTVKNFYTVKENGKDVKVVIKNKDAAKKIKHNRVLTGEREQEFYRGENELLEDESFDVSLYGPRVKGLGFLNYRANISASNNRDESWFDFSKAYEPPSMVTDELVFPWLPEDRDMLQEKLVEMDRLERNVTDLELKKEGEVYKVFVDREQLKEEITKITNAFLDLNQIKSVKTLNQVIEKSTANPEQKYIEHQGRFIKNYGQEVFENRIAELQEEDKLSKAKPKEPTLLIKDNLTELNHREDGRATREMPFETPRSLKIKLFEHQIEGVHKLQTLFQASITNGFLLADDMGLGKTIQILTFLAWLKERGQLSPTLIVAPSILLNAWDNDEPTQAGEIQKFFQPDTFKTYKIQGYRKDFQKDLRIIENSDLVLITYESLRLNNIWLGRVHWKCIVCDEIQAVKNPKTLVSVALKAQNGDFKIACSATPIENTTEDLWNIMDFAVPGVLGSLSQFKGQFVKPIEKLTSDQDDERKILNDQLVQKIGDNFLRRSKEDKLKDLPNKKVVVHLIEASAEEKKRIAEINRLRQQGEPSLPLIQKLVACCSHLRLESNFDPSKIAPKELIAESSKLGYLKKVLDHIQAKGEKAIIFTPFRQMQIVLFQALKLWYSIQPFIINGTLSTDKRSQILSSFRKKKGFDVIILSPLAAGVGITLTEANHVIHYTRLWNPAKEAQATDRVYRIGQMKDVFVYYLILSFESSSFFEFESEKKYVDYFLNEKTFGKTPEEKMNRLLIKKKNMLNNFFLVAGDQAADLKGEWDEEDEAAAPLTLQDVECLLKPSEFKALCGMLYKKLGYQVFLTASSGDPGVDMVIQKDGKNGLIQARMLGDDLPHSALEEVMGAKNIYCNQLEIRIAELIVISTAERITETFKNSAEKYNVKIILRQELKRLLNETKIYYGELENLAKDRFSLEQLKKIIGSIL